MQFIKHLLALFPTLIINLTLVYNIKRAKEKARQNQVTNLPGLMSSLFELSPNTSIIASRKYRFIYNKSALNF